MVAKSRNRVKLVPVSFNGVLYANLGVDTLGETMVDSSTTGSPLTEVDAVDAYLADPSGHRGDFQRALQQSYKTAGDAGLASFRVDRSFKRTSTVSATIKGNNPVPSVLENWFPSFPADSAFPSITPYSTPSNQEVKILGEELYLRALPNEEQASLGETMAEIAASPVRALAVPGKNLAQVISRQQAGSPTRWAERLRILQLSRDDAVAAADDYLAYIFGARPTLQVLDDLSDAYSRSREVAETITRKGLGKTSNPRERRVRRRRVRNYPDVVATSVVPKTLAGVGVVMSPWRLYGTAHYYHASTKKTWWSGSFRMVTSDTDDWLMKCNNFFRRVDELSGIGLDIRVAWDLVPWSFVADWFANTGDCLENRQRIADYNIACEYGYFMCHTRESREMSITGQLRKSSNVPWWGSVDAGIHYESVVEVKRRHACGAYGFHSTFDGLNNFQWTALAALGLSRLPGVAPRVRS